MKIAQRMAKVSPSATLKLAAKAKELKAQGKPVISFTAGEPDFNTPEPIVAEAVASLKGGFTKYTPTSGMPELRQAVAAKFLQDQGLQYSPEEVVISCGAKHSLYNLIQVLCDPGDEVLIPTPYWVSYPEMVYVAGGVPVFIPTRQEDGFKLKPEALKKAITPKSRILFLNSPSNPRFMNIFFMTARGTSRLRLLEMRSRSAPLS
jgi:aspartate aminotransferase